MRHSLGVKLPGAALTPSVEAVTDFAAPQKVIKTKREMKLLDKEERKKKAEKNVKGLHDPTDYDFLCRHSIKMKARCVP